MSNTSVSMYAPATVTPPGATLADLLEERGIRQNELAVRLDVTPKFVNELILGKVSITPKTALLLERALGVAADFWLTRDAHFQAFQIRSKGEEDLVAQKEWLSELPIGEMVKFGWIQKHRALTAQVTECLRFFAVASMSAWKSHYVERISGSTAWRISSTVTKAEGSISAWLRRGEIEAVQRSCKPFDREKLLSALLETRTTTLEPDPQKFVPILQQRFAECGVVVLFIPAPKGCPASGAVRWISPNKALIQLSLRYKTNDHLWFTFFHECFHLLLHGKKILFLEVKGMDDKDEDEANAHAAQILIPEEKLSTFRVSIISRESIIHFAKVLGIAPGIVVGRLQKEEIVDWSAFNDLKIRYEWAHAAQ